MFRTYKQPSEDSIFISHWDGDCTSYTVFESEEEKQMEVKRIKKIDEEVKQNTFKR